MRINAEPDGYLATNMHLNLLIQDAYDLRTEEQVAGLPAWAGSASFDIQGKMDAETVGALKKLSPLEADAQRRLMMQALLEERFHLKIHHEMKELPTYELVLAKGGSKLKESDPAAGAPGGSANGGRMNFRGGLMTAQSLSMSNLVTFLSRVLHRQVIDKTGLTGSYDMTLQWTPDEGPAPVVNGQPVEAPPLLTAVEEQLGLKLEAKKGPVDTVIVDHVEMPSEN